MKILFVNEITNIRGGVETLVENEILYLKKNNIEVELFSIDHKRISHKNYFSKIISVLGFFLQRKEFQKLIKKINNFKPDIIHFHNIYPFWGYPIWKFKISNKIKIIQHLHNYNPFCLNSFFYRDGSNCTLCLDKKHLFQGLAHKCYNNSYALSLLGYILRASPKLWLKYSKNVDLFISVSKSVEDVYIHAGVNKSKIKILPNAIFLSKKEKISVGNYVLYLGNIVVEKGVELVCQLAEKNPDIDFIIAGEGRDYEFLKKKYSYLINLKFIGYISDAVKDKILSESRLIIFPSLCRESFGIVILEAFSYGKPVLSTGLGGIRELVKHNITGKIVEDINLENFNRQLLNLWSELEVKDNHYFCECTKVAKNYGLENHVQKILQIYQELLRK
ncbi:MAG: glycosyltransferase family 4 protein [Melioribacteraceae bacterium]